jgi:hypothetical protein
MEKDSLKLGQPTQDSRDTQLVVSSYNLGMCRIAHIVQKRREQLRISQKAYRIRKRDEHSRLQKRVAELENGVHEINVAFLNISKLLLDTKATEHRLHLASALREVTRECLSLAEIVQTPTSASSQEVPESDSNCSQVNDAGDDAN